MYKHIVKPIYIIYSFSKRYYELEKKNRDSNNNKIILWKKNQSYA